MTVSEWGSVLGAGFQLVNEISISRTSPTAGANPRSVKLILNGFDFMSISASPTPLVAFTIFIAADLLAFRGQGMAGEGAPPVGVKVELNSMENWFAPTSAVQLTSVNASGGSAIQVLITGGIGGAPAKGFGAILYM